MESLIGRLSGVAARRRWWFVAAWLVLLAASSPFAGKAQSVLSSGGFEVPGSQSKRAIDYFNRQPGRGAQPFTFLVAAPSPELAQARLAQVRATVARRFPAINFTSSPVRSRDGRTIAVTGFAAVTQNQALKVARDVKRAVQVTGGSTRTFLLGPAANYATFQDITESDLRSAEALSAPVILIVLLTLFGAVVAAAVPALLGAFAVLITFAGVYAVASRTEVSVYATTMVTMIGLGVAVDYSMFILARFREELARGAGRDAALATAMRTSGTAVVFSGLTVMVSLASIWVVPVRAVQSMALAAVMVVAVTLLAAVSLLPAVLVLLGERVNRLHVGRRRDLSATSAFWTRWAGRVMERPVPAVLAAGGLLILLALPALSLRTENRALEQLPGSTDVRRGTALLTGRITGPGQGREGALTVLLRPRGGRAGGALAGDAERIRAQLARDPLISAAQLEQVGGAPVVFGYLRVDPESDPAVNRLVPRVRRMVAGDGLGGRAEVDVSGLSAAQRDLNAEVGGDLWKVMALVMALSYLVLLALLRSVLLPLKAVVMNLLSIGAAYGVLVMVFQWGWFDFTGFHSLGHVNTLTPPLMLAITFGLAMDYEVFLLSRIGERYRATGSNTQAVAEGLAGSARIITSAALIMTVVFASFVLTGVPAIKEIGLGLAVAIAVDATITRLVLVPGAMRLLGDWNWWLPGWLDRLLPRVEPAPPAAGEPASAG